MSELNVERIEEIKQLVALVPTDPFPLYGLAMEYKNSGDLAQAMATFRQLMDRFPDYVPQYLMHGQLLANEVKDRAEAKRVLTLGVAKASAARNHHAQGEIQSLLDRLSDEDE
jgi:tetratricopeptide (TPR) repeat protein